MGRNVVEAPGLTWPQFSLSKQWSFYEGARFILRWDMNNPFKSPNYGGPGFDLQPAEPGNFGRIGTQLAAGSRMSGRRSRIICWCSGWSGDDQSSKFASKPVRGGAACRGGPMRRSSPRCTETSIVNSVYGH